MRRLMFLALATMLLGTSYSVADEASLATRLQQLEAETQSLRSELQTLRSSTVRLPAVEATPVNWSGDELPAAGATDYYTFDQVHEMMETTAKKYAWRKGDFTITPYGFLWGNMVYETQETVMGSYCLYVPSLANDDGDNFVVDARNTRIGFDVVGPRLRCFNCATSGGKVEFDFQGAFVTENKPGVLLRHAYWEVKNDDFRLLMGQTWDVIAPLNPGTIMYSVYWAAGNIGYRRPQLRYERYLDFSPYSMLTLEGSLNLSVASDFTATNDDIDNDHDGWPVIEGRAAWTLGSRGKGCNPIVIGTSGHIGNQHFHFGATTPIPGIYVRRTWSINADFTVPVTQRLAVQGEFFTGENLSTFLGGILQGVDPNTAKTIRSTGGWVGVRYDWASDWHSYAGYTIDDPFDDDITTASGRIYNSAYFLNLTHDITKQFSMGVEISSWKTLFHDERPGEAVRCEFMAKYGF